MTISAAPETALRQFEGHTIPAPGTYVPDPAHSSVEFVGRHLMITKVRGSFRDLSADIHIGADPRDSSVEATVQVASIDTGDEKRDGHLLSPDFFDVEKYPTIHFRSTGLEPGLDGTWKLTGDLTVRDVTRPVVLDVEFLGASPDPWGGQRIGFTATTEVDREDWGLTWNMALESGGVLVGKKVRLELNIQATRVS